MARPEKPPIVLSHSAWFTNESWLFVQDELSALGFYALAPALPTADFESNSTIDDDVSALNEATKDMDSFLAVFISRSGALVSRLLNAIKDPQRAKKIVVINSAGPHEYSGPSRYSEGYQDAIRDQVKLGMEAVKHYFLNDTDNKAVLELAERSLCKQRSANNTASSYSLPPMPDATPVRVIVGLHDRALNPERQIRVSREFYGVEPTQLPWPHMPNFTHPVGVARLIASAASSL